MTILRKTVKRTCERSTVFERGKHRPLVVSLEPNGTIGLRAKGCRTTYFLPMKRAWRMAAEAEGLAKKRAKEKAKKDGKDITSALNLMMGGGSATLKVRRKK